MTAKDLIPLNDEEHSENMKKYKFIRTKPQPIFDQLTAAAATLLNAPMAMINFIDTPEVWNSPIDNNKSAVEGDSENNLSSLAILHDKVTEFDGIQDEISLISNPIIASEHGFRFYAAAPIVTDEGFRVGSVCVVDQDSRDFSADDQKKLEKVADMVRLEMNKRLQRKPSINTSKFLTVYM